MDFSFTEEQDAVGALARQILEDRCSHERLREREASAHGAPVGFDEGTWRALADANLLGIAIPEDVGGSGLGLVELCLILEQVGRMAAPVPALATLVLGALPMARFGNPEQRARWLRPVVSADLVLSAALVEPGASPTSPQCSARRDPGGASGGGVGWRLEGVKTCVPAGMQAGLVLVPASTPEGQVGVFVVDPGSPGLTRAAQDTTSGQPEALFELDGVAVDGSDVLGDVSAGAAILEWLLDRATVAVCATAIGVCEEALRLTAEYTKSRQQFDRPIATFQAVGQRAADAYVDTEAVRLTTWQAAWRLASELPATAEVAVAKFWAAEGGQRVVHAATHLHGGVGVDRDYPLHRLFLWAKHLELTLGGPTIQLLRLGEVLAGEPA
ncbi:MAG: acyl-CoA dehydrogenase family protein [Acidimicrobiales bacterium]